MQRFLQSVLANSVVTVIGPMLVPAKVLVTVSTGNDHYHYRICGEITICEFFDSQNSLNKIFHLSEQLTFICFTVFNRLLVTPIIGKIAYKENYSNLNIRVCIFMRLYSIIFVFYKIVKFVYRTSR